MDLRRKCHVNYLFIKVLLAALIMYIIKKDYIELYSLDPNYTATAQPQPRGTSTVNLGVANRGEWGPQKGFGDAFDKWGPLSL